VQINEQDASVFWALIIGSNHRKNIPIKTSTILEITNTERKKHWMESLNSKQLKKSLEKLRSLGVIKQDATKSWIIIEAFTIRD
jgi:predicted nucleic acid-binding protein